MRLLNIKTLKLELFWDHRIRPTYAILSHTWDKNEVTYADIWDLQLPAKDSLRQISWSKILGACLQASKDEIDYIWIDTLCIDKSSSAELSEAINSMFAWYRDAKICYAYLPDVKSAVNHLRAGGLPDLSSFVKSRWFTRGWTLQELLAPPEVNFYGNEWRWLGSKSDLAADIHTITGIDEGILRDPRKIKSQCVATRLSWASKRETTRVEDLAYCLLGLFGVHMPLIYGEGERAFARLQEEIMKTTSDQSIFAWQRPEALTQEKSEFQTGLLASSPSFFAEMQQLTTFRDWTETNPAFELTNFGVSIELPLLRLNDRYFVAILNCARDPPRCVGLLLYAHTLSSPVFSRVHNYGNEWPVDLAKAEGIRRRIFVSEPRELIYSTYKLIVSGCLLRTQLTEESLRWGYKLEGCLYDTDAGNGLGLPGWSNRHWKFSDDQNGSSQPMQAATSQDWRRLWHNEFWCSDAKLEVPGEPKVLVAALLIFHAQSGTRFLVLIGTGARPELVHIDCYFPEDGFELEDQNLAELALRLRRGFDFDSKARYSQDSGLVYSHDISFEFTCPREYKQSVKSSLYKKQRIARHPKHYIRLQRHENGDRPEMQLDIITEEAARGASAPVAENGMSSLQSAAAQYRVVVGED